jgi:DNA gyrase/topoisomerase IV subunit A
VTELPYGVTTESLIESILAANAKGKIKIKHVDDNTADKVEILIHLPPSSDPAKVIQQLYVFTSCQVQLNPAACVIVRDPKTRNDKPHFVGVRDILKTSVEATDKLMADAARRADRAVSLHEFTHRLNRELPEADKLAIVEMLWQVSRADGRIDKHEEQLVQRIAGLLHISDKDRMRLKLKTIVAG